ncbi:hypothetical protein LZ30DRAFT_357182 [Colletotrichum cereale]|nr:hypothetical protein LZ30DRAFT_357182 [Colletotrichum cereale]
MGINRLRNRRIPFLQLPQLPNESHLDPYIVALLIAQAQRCQQQDASSYPENHTLKAEASYRVHVILSDIQDKKQIRVHTADVTNAFLDKLAHLSKKPGPADATSLNIWHTAVQYEPHETLHRRLMAAIYHSSRGLKRRRPEE